jgi:L-ascorbate metabolism protein UlaG (beta-lactamase superfamily)
MIISYLGKECFKITQGDFTMVINPPNKDSKWSKGISRFGANVAISTTLDDDFSGTELFSYGETVPFEIRGAGRYEVQGIEVIGSAFYIERGGRKLLNTVYTITIDDIDIAFLGPITTTEITGEAREVLGSPHILFIPIGGGDVIDPKAAAKIAVMLDAHITIPMDYDDNKDALKLFLKEMGSENVKPEDKVTLKRRDIESKEGEVIVLSY